MRKMISSMRASALRNVAASAVLACGLVAAAGPAMAFFSYTDGESLPAGLNKSLTSTNFSLISGSYSLLETLAGNFISPSGFASVTATLEKASGGFIGSVTETISAAGGTQIQGTYGASGSNTAGLFNVTAGMYKFAYTTSLSAGSAFSLSTAATTGVGMSAPGPIAGAGLPALLAVLGLAGFYRTRKNWSV